MAEYTPHTALIVVDMQNDFADPNGSLYVHDGERVVPLINAELARAQDAGAFIVYTQDWHPEHTPHFAQDGGVWPAHCVQETWGAAFHPDLHIDGPVVRKGTSGEDGYSGFSVRDPRTAATHPTELESLLRGHDVQAVVVVGLATDYCVRDTSLDAARLGFDTTLLTDVVRAVDLNPGDGARAIEAMRDVGVHIA
jgi:nicotinamidase/pyrazinamidase